MTMPSVAVITGYGINCDRETAFAFEQAGAKTDIIHINDIIDGHKKFSNYQILVFPGGFSYGDDTGSGKALANRIRNNLWEELECFVKEGNHLTLGICNGFQVLVNLGLLPALNHHYGEQQVALVHNDSARYIDRWVDIRFEKESPWTSDIGEISVPVAHGEGKFYAPPETMKKIKEKSLIAARYVLGEICLYHNAPPNPNGSLEDIAAISDESGRILGMMPHPERAIAFTHLPHWTLLKEHYKRAGRDIPEEGPGLQIFKNAVKYFV